MGCSTQIKVQPAIAQTKRSINNDYIYDVVIIGGGYSGLAAAIYTGRASLNPLVFCGKSETVQPLQTQAIQDYPGFLSIDRSTLIQNQKEQALTCGAKLMFEDVQSIDSQQYPFVIFHDGKQSKTNSIIMATGLLLTNNGIDFVQQSTDQKNENCNKSDTHVVFKYPQTKILDGIVTMERGYISLNHNNQMTSKAGIFAAGACCDPKYHLPVISAASGAKAALDCERWLAQK
eukprot:EST47874.1 Thioredoxin reductase [Spironucleus salmonicida]